MTSAVELVIERWRFQERQCFYSLSAAGAAVGYALVAFDDSASLTSTRLILSALCVWATSMVFGLKLLSLLNASQRMSLAALRLNLTVTQQKTADRIFQREDKKIGQKIGCYRNLQIAFLILGALVYVPSIVDMPAALGFQADMPETLK